MKRHMWIHIGLLVAIVAVLGSRAAGLGVPTAAVYLIVLACPLMMILMMFGMKHDDTTGSGNDHDDDRGTGVDAPREPSSTDVSK